MSQPKLPVLTSVAAGYSFLFANWQRVLILAAPYLITSILLVWNQSAMTATPSGASVGLGLLLLIANLLATIVLTAAVFRLAVRGEVVGWQGFQLGKDELQIFVVTVLVTVLTIVVFMLAMVFAAAFVTAIANGVIEQAGLEQEQVTENMQLVFDRFGAAEWAGVGLVGVLVAAVMMWLTARLALAMPATIDKRRIRVLSVWPMSKGQAWRIAAAMLLTGLPVFIVGYLAYEAVSMLTGVRLLELAHTVDMSVENANSIMRTNEMGRVNGFLFAITAPLYAGLYAFIYAGFKRIAPGGDA